MREHNNENTSQDGCTKHKGTNKDTKCTSHTVATYIVLFYAKGSRIATVVQCMRLCYVLRIGVNRVCVCVALVYSFLLSPGPVTTNSTEWWNVWIVLCLVTFFDCCHLAVFLAPNDSPFDCSFRSLCSHR